jgi:hypothetical protein
MRNTWQQCTTQNPTAQCNMLNMTLTAATTGPTQIHPCSTFAVLRLYFTDLPADPPSPISMCCCGLGPRRAPFQAHVFSPRLQHNTMRH